MFYSENLLAKEGPLAQVWLAANLERKLSKQQFLQSNISQSTEAIVKAASNNDDSEALALRLSGQLLYGVVRIYSRKAKYLLDDVSDALLKLKSAFKSNSNSVTLPVNATIVPSVNQLILQDTITKSDLLYQAPLVFDDEEVEPGKSYASMFGASQATTNRDFNDSIEIPRNKFDELDELQNAEDDLDIDLNFEIEDDVNQKADEDAHLSFDQSIEVGRAGDEANLSTQPEQERGFDFDFGDDGGFDIDLGFDDEPLTPPPEEPTEIIVPDVKKPRKQKVSTAGQRKIVNDREIEIPVKSFSNTADIVDNDNDETELDLNAKRTYIDEILKDNFIHQEISKQLLDVRSTKRQRTMPSPPSEDLSAPELEHSADEANGTNEEEEGYDFERGHDFDFGGWNDIPNDEGQQQLPDIQEAEDEVGEEATDNLLSSNSKDGISESTIKISTHLRGVFETKDSTTFTGVIAKDSLSEKPLSTLPKSEATRVFFELLVLGTNDAVDLKQQELFGEIQVKPRDNLFQKFV